YRWALERVLRLRRLDDDAAEMSPLHFGSLAHAVLESFGRDPAARESTDPEAIESDLLARLDEHARSLFGPNPLPAVRVQLVRLRMRLRGFARCQAAMRADGWVIEHCEHQLEGGATLAVPGQAAMPIHGKIDRIDRHQRTGCWRIIDYKTGEAGNDPRTAHNGRRPGPELRWLDLQLPLYQHLLEQGPLAMAGSIELGYFCLPKDADSVGYKPADWTPDELDAAVDEAREVVRRIRHGEFRRNPDYDYVNDAFARICQTTVLGGEQIA
ncbi:MAG: RecB family exonuclease, partial [Planctomycetota bacterium]